MKYNNILEALGAKTIVVAKEVAEVFILLNMSIYWMICGPFDKGRSKFGGTAKQVFMLGTEATGICFLMVALICFTMALQSSFMLKAVGGGSYLASGLGYLIFAEISPLYRHDHLYPDSCLLCRHRGLPRRFLDRILFL